MFTPQLMHNASTGELALKLSTLGAELVWILPSNVKDYSGEQLHSYLNEIIPIMKNDLLKKKLSNQRKDRRKYEKKGKGKGKLPKDPEECHLKAVE